KGRKHQNKQPRKRRHSWVKRVRRGGGAGSVDSAPPRPPISFPNRPGASSIDSTGILQLCCHHTIRARCIAGQTSSSSPLIAEKPGPPVRISPNKSIGQNCP